MAASRARSRAWTYSLVLVSGLVAANAVVASRTAPRRYVPPPPPVVFHWAPDSPRPPRHATNVPRTLADLRRVSDTGASRCDEGNRTEFFLLEDDHLVLHVSTDTAMRLPGHIPAPEARAPDETALPVLALTRDRRPASAIEIWPCQGEPHRLAVDDLRTLPDRWILVRTPKRFLKLVDTVAHPRRAVLRRVAAVRLVP